MPKQLASTSLEPEIFERVAKVATVDRRSMSEIIAQCVSRSLPELETEILAKEAAVMELKESRETATIGGSHKHGYGKRRGK